MNSSKAIDISKSSLVGLKAELLKKQEEVRKLKEQFHDRGLKPETKQKKKLESQQKSNDGVEERSLKDSESQEDDFDALKKSREVLEAKSRLYAKLKDNPDLKSKYLIDFDLKNKIYKEQQKPDVDIRDSNPQQSDEEKYDSDTNSDPENDWVDFVDTLGRSRRCLRRDLPAMEAKDAKLAETLQPPPVPPAPDVTPELLSWDMQREMMRKKWEEQETILMGKKDIHYQDVRFDEARHHGVGYFEFSVDENERIRQQEALKNLRNETINQQEAAQGLRLRRQQQLQARLAAAHKRRRERLGLPPEEPLTPSDTQDSGSTSAEKEEEHKEPEKVEELEESIKRLAPVRPWDIGKEGANFVMSQEEWVEKKRQERPEEFAPPSNLLRNADDHVGETKKKTQPNFNTSKKLNHKPKLINSNTVTPKDKSFSTVFEDDVKRTVSCDQDRKNESEEEEEEEPSTQPDWKPTPKQIDDLLFKSKQKVFGNTAVNNWKQNFCQSDSLEKQNTEVLYNPVMDIRQKAIRQDSLKVPQSSNLLSKPEKYIKNSNCEENYDLSEDSMKGSIPIRNDEGQRHQFHPSLTEESLARRHKNQSMLKIDNDDSMNPPSPESSSKSESFRNKRKWAEIAPPASMSYYIEDNKRNNTQKPSGSIEMEDSISVGLNYLKSRTSENVKKKVKGLLDII